MKHETDGGKSGGISQTSELTFILNTTTILKCQHYGDVIMGAIGSQITNLTIVYSTFYSDADQRKHQSSAPMAFVRGIHRGPVNSTHKWPVTRKIFPFDDVIMILLGAIPHPTELLTQCSFCVLFHLSRQKPDTRNHLAPRHSMNNLACGAVSIHPFSVIVNPFGPAAHIRNTFHSLVNWTFGTNSLKLEAKYGILYHDNALEMSSGEWWRLCSRPLRDNETLGVLIKDTF